VTYLFILITRITIPFITLVISACHEYAKHTATSLALTHALLLVAPLFFPMLVETCIAPKVPVARVAGDSNALERARGAGHAVAARLVADLRDVTSISFVTPLANVTSRHRASYVRDHVVVMFRIVIEKVYSLLRVNLSVQIYFVTIQTSKHDNSVLFKVVLKPLEFSDSTPAIQIDTGRFEQVLDYWAYLPTLAIRL